VTPGCSESSHVASPSEVLFENERVSESEVIASPKSDSTFSPKSNCTGSPKSNCTASPKSDSSPKRRRPQMMEELGDDAQADNAAQPCPESNPLGSFCQWPLSPSQITQTGCIGGMIQRTFIHHPLPPPTPAKGRGTGSCLGVRIRSHSMPKDFGSPKCVFADALHALVYLHRPVHSAPASDADDASSKCDSPVISSLSAVQVGPAPSF